MIEVGDIVSRQIEIGKPLRKFGKVLEKYKSAQSSTSHGHWLYKVQWDDKSVEAGYMEHGLEKV